jgi:hemolysin activation/secretion protein
MILQRLPCFLQLVFPLFLAANLYAEEPSAELQREAEEAAKEEEEEQKLPPDKQPRSDYEGKLNLTPPEGAPKGVIGTFVLKNNTSILLKVEDPNLEPQLKIYHGKNITLLAKVRNQGKYLVAYGVVHPPVPTPENFKRGGL